MQNQFGLRVYSLCSAERLRRAFQSVAPQFSPTKTICQLWAYMCSLLLHEFDFNRI